MKMLQFSTFNLDAFGIQDQRNFPILALLLKDLIKLLHVSFLFLQQKLGDIRVKFQVNYRKLNNSWTILDLDKHVGEIQKQALKILRLEETSINFWKFKENCDIV